MPYFEREETSSRGIELISYFFFGVKQIDFKNKCKLKIFGNRFF